MNKLKIGIIGLGYVGLPLAVEFAKKFNVIGFDINSIRVKELNLGDDKTLEVSSEKLNEVLVENDSIGLINTSELSELVSCNVYVITVPTPTDKNNRPDLSPLYSASKMIGEVLSKDDIVIYESTVYPGVTEDECVPVLEQSSGLTYNKDFFVGYSPERINPGDKLHTVTKIKKVTSGSTPEIGRVIDDLYKSIIVAGTHLAPSIKVAEAAKVIENSQRDINIAFVNELSKIFNRLDIDTAEVLKAAGTKWNFLNFKPGLVGGHCIGVDPYYLAQKAQEVGYHPEIILAGRRLNDGMGAHVANEFVKCLIGKEHLIKKSKVLMLGLTFKENCPDIRNTRAIDIYSELNTYGLSVDVYDPWANSEQVQMEYGITLIDEINMAYDGIILAVAHDRFLELDFNALKSKNAVLYDVKSVLPKDIIDARL